LRRHAASGDAPEQTIGACACGGGCPRCAAENLMPKLAVSTPDNHLEREADRIALALTSAPAMPPSAETATASGGPPSIQRACDCGGGSEKGCSCAEPIQLLQSAPEASATTRAPPSVSEVLSSSGEPLDDNVRREFEPSLAFDFSGVRVHRDSAAAESASEVGALAYTLGRDIVFASGQYAPETQKGRGVIAHELAHVVQQASATKPGIVQRQAGGGAPAGGAPAGGAPAGGAPGGPAPAPAGGPPLSVKYNGCAQAPYTLATVQAAAQAAYNAVLTTNCIHSPLLRSEILSEFSQLTIDCEQGDSSDPCGRAMYVFSHTANLFPDSLTATCGPLESTILHEVVHLTEVRLWGHGDLAGACEASCFGWGSGDPAKCTDEGKVRHGPSFALGMGSGAAGTGLFGRVGYDVVKSWAASSFSLGLRLDVPLTDKESFVRAGLEVGANHKLLGALYGRLFTGLSVPWPPGSRPPSLYLGAGLQVDLGRTQLELLYDVLDVQSKDERSHQFLLGVGFRFGK
jgi:hypothetical protein